MAKREELQEKLKDLITQLGEWNINVSKLAREWQMPVRTVHNWRNKIIKDMGPINITEVGRNFNNALRHNMALAQQIKVTAKNNKEKLDSIRVINDTIKSYSDFLERYGHKVKIADKVEFERVVPKGIKEEMEEYKKELEADKVKK